MVIAMHTTPIAVIIAAILQYLLAASFVAVPIYAYRYGTQAQRAAEADVTRQGYPASLLAKHKIKMTERAVDTLFPFAIALVFAVMASLNLAGDDIGRLMSWILQPVALVAIGLVCAAQVFTVPFIESAFRRSGDPELKGIDVKAFIGAARKAFPAGARAIIIARFVVATAGSALVIVLLSLPQADAYFR